MLNRGLIALAVAALAVCCLGALTITSQRTELMVGSYNVGRPAPNTAAPHQPHGYGNQAASMGDSPQFYNGIRHAHGVKARIGQKNLVGSYPVQRKGIPKQRPQFPLSHFIGDQMKNSARKSASQKLMVGSFQVQPSANGKTQPHQPHGIGNQAAPHYGIASGFYNHAARKVRTNKLLVGSSFVDPKAKSHAQPHGYGNQAMQMGENPNFYNAPVSHKSKSQKLLVGSFNVDAQHKGVSHPGIGNQAAPMNHMDVGTNIVFHGVHSEGGILGARKHMQKKGLVGSYFAGRPNGSKKAPVQPHGYGDQSNSHAGGANFYNAAPH